MKKIKEEEKLTKHQTSLLSAYFIDRDFLEEPLMWEEAQEDLNQEMNKILLWNI
jgi:hypothetical protein